jgi:hypothetical protein
LNTFNVQKPACRPKPCMRTITLHADPTCMWIQPACGSNLHADPTSIRIITRLLLCQASGTLGSRTHGSCVCTVLTCQRCTSLLVKHCEIGQPISKPAVSTPQVFHAQRATMQLCSIERSNLGVHYTCPFHHMHAASFDVDTEQVLQLGADGPQQALSAAVVVKGTKSCKGGHTWAQLQ